MRFRGLSIPWAAVAVVGIVAGCGGGDSAETSAAAGGDSTEAAAVAGDEVAIAEFSYAPETVAVDAGDRVIWTNRDDAAHTATADDGSFDTGTLEKGDSAPVSFDEPGTYSYYCRFHAFMKATVEVR
jgi:plastocyanin